VKAGGVPALQKLARFKLELAEAVKKERFEAAARLRDRINILEQKLRDASRISKIGEGEINV